MSGYDKNNVFAKILRKEIPAAPIYEDDRVAAFRDISPQAPTHILIVPKKSIATPNDLTAEDAGLIGHMVLTARKLAAEAGIAESGYRIVINCNAGGGQSVFHLHLHLLGGRQMHWPPG